MYYYQHHIGDYLKHTAHLTPLEDIAYRRLLDVYYDTETPIPTDIPQVSRRLRIDFATVQLVLDEYFQLTEEGYRNKRADAEIAAYHAFLQKQKCNGIKGGRPKSKPTDNPRVSEPEPKITLTEKREPITDNLIKTKACFFIPNFIPQDAWKGFYEMRKTGKGVFTERAASLIIKQLTQMHSEGQDVSKVLDQSTANGWKGVFPLKTQHGATNAKFNVHTAGRESLARALAEEKLDSRAPWEIQDSVPAEVQQLFSRPTDD
jgi:uncharacterized protein YdaU (DUF1376 family)